MRAFDLAASSKSGDVRPRLAAFDATDKRRSHFEALRDSDVRGSVRDHASNLRDVGLCELGPREFATAPDQVWPLTHGVTGTTPDKAICNRMSLMLSISQVFQVVPSVVSTVGVNVIDLAPIRARTNECLGNEMVNIGVSPDVFDAKGNLEIRRGTIWIEDARPNGLRCPSQPTNPSDVADFVGVPPRNWSPFFSGIGHSSRSIRSFDTELYPFSSEDIAS